MPRWGNLRRVEPFSKSFGSDRGKPVDRYYLDRFLDAQPRADHGPGAGSAGAVVHEAFRRGPDESHTVDINPGFQATYVCDLADGAPIPSDYYDCFLAPNTLQHLLDLHPALRTMLRVVKPGGTVLASAAMLLPLIPEGGDYWRLTPEGWRIVLGVEWPHCEIAVQGARQLSVGRRRHVWPGARGAEGGRARRVRPALSGADHHSLPQAGRVLMRP